MKQIISFHKHEVASADILEKRLTALGFGRYDIEVSKRLVQLHQTRFYKDTTTKTHRAFLRNLGKGHIDKYFAVLRADRAGNKKNQDKPVTTRFNRLLELTLRLVDQNTVYEQDLCICKLDLIMMGVKREQINAALNNMTAIVQLRPDRNNLLFLTRYIEKNYLEKKDDRYKGLPDW